MKHYQIVIGIVLYATGMQAQQRNNDDSRPGNRPTARQISWVNEPDSPAVGTKHFVLKSSALGRDVGYTVWTPSTYRQNHAREYPVLYFLHGAGGDETKDAGGFSQWLNTAINDGALPPVICVFPNGGMSGYRDSVERMIINELIPHIDSAYLTIADPQGRAILGFSMGGAGAVYLSIKHPHLFAAVGSMGGGIRMESEQLQADIAMALPEWKRRKVGFFFVNGDNDRPDAFKQFVGVLENKGISHRLEVLPETNHNLALYYERSVVPLLRFIGARLHPNIRADCPEGAWQEFNGACYVTLQQSSAETPSKKVSPSP